MELDDDFDDTGATVIAVIGSTGRPDEPVTMAVSANGSDEKLVIDPESPLRQIPPRHFTQLLQYWQQLGDSHRQQVQRLNLVKQGCQTQKRVINIIKLVSASAAAGCALASFIPTFWSTSMQLFAVSTISFCLSIVADYELSRRYWQKEFDMIKALPDVHHQHIKARIRELDEYAKIYMSLYKLRKNQAETAVFLNTEFGLATTVKYTMDAQLRDGHKQADILRRLMRKPDDMTTQNFTTGPPTPDHDNDSLLKAQEMTAQSYFKHLRQSYYAVDLSITMVKFLGLIRHPVITAAERAVDLLRERIITVENQHDRLTMMYNVLNES